MNKTTQLHLYVPRIFVKKISTPEPDGFSVTYNNFKEFTMESLYLFLDGPKVLGNYGDELDSAPLHNNEIHVVGFHAIDDEGFNPGSEGQCFNFVSLQQYVKDRSQTNLQELFHGDKRGMNLSYYDRNTHQATYKAFCDPKITYKKCCIQQCPVEDCEVSFKGGCLCVCRVVKYIQAIESIKDGTCIYSGNGFFTYFVDKEKCSKQFAELTDLERYAHNEFVKTIDNKLKEYNKRVKQYAVLSKKEKDIENHIAEYVENPNG